MNTIVFDFDGTLADTRNLIVSTMQQTIAQLGLPAKTELECIKMIGLPLRQSFAQLLSVDDEQTALCENLYKNLFVKNYKPGIVVLFPDVEDTLAEMRAMGCVLAVASSRGHDSLDTLLDMLNIRRFFSYVVTSEDVPNAKPAPDMVNLILDYTEDIPENVLVVGDTAYDVNMGFSAGVKTCAVTYGNGAIGELAHADFIIHNFKTLLDII